MGTAGPPRAPLPSVSWGEPDLAWEAVYKDATVPPGDDLTTTYADREEGVGCEARAGLTRELELGYVAALLTSEAGSRTL